MASETSGSASCAHKGIELLPGQSSVKRSDFHTLQHLGEGSVGIVTKVRHKTTGEICALKALDKRRLFELDMGKQLLAEIQTQIAVSHPNLLRCLDWFHDDECVCLVLEYASGGDLFRLLKSQGALSGPDAAHVFAQCCEGVKYLHGRGTIHRDLKPENILLHEDLHVKIADFGWCAEANGRTTFCGTLCMLAPEMVAGRSYDASVDIWALGVLLFEMLVGFSPFDRGGSLLETCENIVRHGLSQTLLQKCARAAQSLVQGLLQQEASQRIPLDEALRHPWVREQVELRRAALSSLSEREFIPPTAQLLVPKLSSKRSDSRGSPSGDSPPKSSSSHSPALSRGDSARETVGSVASERLEHVVGLDDGPGSSAHASRQPSAAECSMADTSVGIPSAPRAADGTTMFFNIGTDAHLGDAVARSESEGAVGVVPDIVIKKVDSVPADVPKAGPSNVGISAKRGYVMSLPSSQANLAAPPAAAVGAAVVNAGASAATAAAVSPRTPPSAKGKPQVLAPPSTPVVQPTLKVPQSSLEIFDAGLVPDQKVELPADPFAATSPTPLLMTYERLITNGQHPAPSFPGSGWGVPPASRDIRGGPCRAPAGRRDDRGGLSTASVGGSEAGGGGPFGAATGKKDMGDGPCGAAAGRRDIGDGPCGAAAGRRDIGGGPCGAPANNRGSGYGAGHVPVSDAQMPPTDARVPLDVRPGIPVPRGKALAANRRPSADSGVPQQAAAGYQAAAAVTSAHRPAAAGPAAARPTAPSPGPLPGADPFGEGHVGARYQGSPTRRQSAPSAPAGHGENWLTGALNWVGLGNDPEAQLQPQQQVLLAQLRDLGFSHAQAFEAVRRTSSVEAAVEWILSNGN